jgi:hypothetical protein
LCENQGAPMYESEKSRSTKKSVKNQGAQKKSVKNQGTPKKSVKNQAAPQKREN